MDTPTALQLIQGLINDNNAEIAARTSQNQGYQIVLDQLNGILNTPSADLTEARTALTTEQAAHQSDNTTNQTTIATQTQLITDLTDQVTGLGGTPVTQ